MAVQQAVLGCSDTHFWAVQVFHQGSALSRLATLVDSLEQDEGATACHGHCSCLPAR